MGFFKKAHAGRPPTSQLVKTHYTSKPVAIPSDFLSCSKENLTPVTYTRIDFSTTPVPEYRHHYAVVLDNVLSPSECKQLIHLAEQSTGAHDPDGESQNDGWQPALVNAGAGYEVAATDYRNSDRIIWDEKEVVRRIWERCLLAPGLREDLEVIEGPEKEGILGKRAVGLGHRWKATRLNERMRFLRYGKGQFFKGIGVFCPLYRLPLSDCSSTLHRNCLVFSSSTGIYFFFSLFSNMPLVFHLLLFFLLSMFTAFHTNSPFNFLFRVPLLFHFIFLSSSEFPPSPHHPTNPPFSQPIATAHTKPLTTANAPSTHCTSTSTTLSKPRPPTPQPRPPSAAAQLPSTPPRRNLPPLPPTSAISTSIPEPAAFSSSSIGASCTRVMRCSMASSIR